MGYELPEDLMEMARNLVSSYDSAYRYYEKKVSDIIKNRVRNTDYIEHVLDSIMDIPTEKAYKLFVLLCKYVRTFDEDVADDYMEIYNELYGEDEPTIRKK